LVQFLKLMLRLYISSVKQIILPLINKELSNLYQNIMFSLLKPTSYITCDVKCWHIQNSSSSVTHYRWHFYVIHPWVIWYSWIFHRESDLIRWKTGIVCTWYLICIIKRNIVGNYFLFCSTMFTWKALAPLACVRQKSLRYKYDDNITGLPCSLTFKLHTNNKKAT
jgi:hypothetical protein